MRIDFPYCFPLFPVPVSSASSTSRSFLPFCFLESGFLVRGGYVSQFLSGLSPPRSLWGESSIMQVHFLAAYHMALLAERLMTAVLSIIRRLEGLKKGSLFPAKSQDCHTISKGQSRWDRGFKSVDLKLEEFRHLSRALNQFV
jgi:hypothetical protein